MDYLFLQSALQTSPAVRLLRSQSAAMIVSFLFETFKRDHVLTLPRTTLLERLRDHLDDLRAFEPEAYPRSTEAYLNEWCEDGRFLRMFYEQGSDDPVVELTPDAERVLQWIEDLGPREFVGTESRFQRIFELLQEIVERSEEDPEARIARLEAEKAEIEREIERIRLTGQVVTMSGTQVRERFLEANELARALLADFREVEHNFKQITRQVQQEGLRTGITKGSIVGQVIDADDALKASDQGQSFYAFWRFLLSPERQADLESYIEEVYRLPEVEALGEEQPTLRRVQAALIDAGDKVVRSNHRLADQLRRLLDERNLAENRRVLDLITEIKQHASRLAADPPDDADFVEMDDRPAIDAPLERPLWQPADTATFVGVVPREAGEDADEIDLSTLFNPFAIDAAELEARVAQVLLHRSQATLAEIAAVHPIARGLAELVAYFHLGSAGGRTVVNEAVRERIPVTTPGSGPVARYVSVPQLIFTRSQA